MNRNVVWNGMRERLLVRLLSMFNFIATTTGSALLISGSGQTLSTVTTVTNVTTVTRMAAYGQFDQTGLSQAQSTEAFQVGQRRNLVFS